MQITVELPDELVSQLLPDGADPSRTILEELAVEAYRAHRLTEHQLATILSMDRYALDCFLKAREVWLDLSMNDLRQQIEAHRSLGL